MNEVCAIVLAAGKGTRMKDRTPKVLRILAGRPIIYWPISLLKSLNIPVVIVTGYKARMVEKFIKRSRFKVIFARQKKLLGTGYAVKIALKRIPNRFKAIFVLFGDDSALYSPITIKRFIKFSLNKGFPATILVRESTTLTSLGGLKKDESNNVTGIYSQEQLLENKISSHEQVCGAFLFEKTWLFNNIRLIKKNPKSGEYLLPSLIEIAAKNREYVKTFRLNNDKEWQSVNTEDDIIEAERKKKLLLTK